MGQADVRVGGSHEALGGGNVRPAFQQFTRDGNRDAGAGIEGFLGGAERASSGA